MRREISEAAERNKGPILDVLRDALPPRGLVLEVASGTGQHVAALAAALPELTFQPSDRDALLHPSIAAWCEALPNVRPSLAIDVTAADWGIAAADAVLAINMIHIAPWEACLGLLGGGARLLPPGGLLYLYGPFRVGGGLVASNAAFDQSLRARNPAWGVRDLEAVAAEAAARGFALQHMATMPANNLSVLFRRG